MRTSDDSEASVMPKELGGDDEIEKPGNGGTKSLWVVVPCMSRLGFVRRTAPNVLAQPDVRYCLVDYSCPDRCGDWLEETFPGDVARGRAVVERVTGRHLFNKSAAHNCGGRRAVREGAQYLCFLDADTLIGPGFLPWIMGNLRENQFLIAARLPDGRDRPSLTGLLVVHAGRFVESGGLDETFQGWGGEDIEFRIRLRLLHGLVHADVPVEHVEALPHGDDLRTLFYRQKNGGISNHCNLRKLKYRIWHTWRGRWKVDPSTLERLWYRPWPSR